MPIPAAVVKSDDFHFGILVGQIVVEDGQDDATVASRELSDLPGGIASMVLGKSAGVYAETPNVMSATPFYRPLVLLHRASAELSGGEELHGQRSAGASLSSSSPNHLNITVFVWCCGGTNVATVNSSAATDCAEMLSAGRNRDDLAETCECHHHVLQMASRGDRRSFGVPKWPPGFADCRPILFAI